MGQPTSYVLDPNGNLNLTLGEAELAVRLYICPIYDYIYQFQSNKLITGQPAFNFTLTGFMT